jgi:transposase
MKKITSEKKKVGRPSGYKPEYCQTVLKEMRDGASIEEVAYELKVFKSTLYSWMDNYPEFSDAIKNGVEFSEGWWRKEGRKNIRNKDFNSTLWYMNMKNRFGWKDKTEMSGAMTINHEQALKELE